MALANQILEKIAVNGEDRRGFLRNRISGRQHQPRIRQVPRHVTAPPLNRLLHAGPAIDDYWALVLQDINSACDVFDPVYESSGGQDGFVSVEVDPGLAHDGDGTEAAARGLHEQIDRRNLMVKIPGTAAGLPA